MLESDSLSTSDCCNLQQDSAPLNTVQNSSIAHEGKNAMVCEVSLLLCQLFGTIGQNTCTETWILLVNNSFVNWRCFSLCSPTHQSGGFWICSFKRRFIDGFIYSVSCNVRTSPSLSCTCGSQQPGYTSSGLRHLGGPRRNKSAMAGSRRGTSLPRLEAGNNAFHWSQH